MQRIAAILLLVALVPMPLRAGFQSWPMLARDAARSSSADSFAGVLDIPDWIAGTDENGLPIEFAGQSGPVLWHDLAYAVGESDGADRLYAIDRTDGIVRFSTVIEPPSFDSWSTPIVDATNRAVISTSGNLVQAFDAESGAPLWNATLGLDVVNASAVITPDLGPRDRLFITDSDGFLIQGGGSLYCINIDPFDALENPFDPGEIVWAIALAAASSGNSPAYDNGVVFVADAGDPNFGSPGRVRAFDATAILEPGAQWTFINTINTGFFGGVSVSNQHVYAASFTFNGGQDSANLVKLDASTGALVWSSPANRTASLPIILDDGRVLLSTGLAGFGSLPALQLFSADGTRLWDSALSTFEDLDGDMLIEPGEFLAVGGWTHVPLVVTNEAGTFAYVGTPPLAGGFFGPNTDVHLIDLDLLPSDTGFVIETFAGAGSTPALADGVLYTIGAAGLHAFGVFPGFAPEDINRDCNVDIEDLYAWESGIGARDVTGNGTVDQSDRDALRAVLRAGELVDIVGGAP